jgi:hypothetical protein
MLDDTTVAMYSSTSSGMCLALCLLAEDGDAGLEVGRLDVGDEAPLEATAHPVLEACQVLGCDVARDDDLLVVIVQGVEGVEERLLRLRAALQELDVVDQEDVDVAVACLEGGAAVVGDGVDEVVRELLARDVSDADAGVERLGIVADRVQQVRLAESGVAVDEERVVRLGRCLSHGDRRCMREAVGLADDEVVEGVLRVQTGFVAQRRGLLDGEVRTCGLGTRRVDAAEIRHGDGGRRLVGEFVVHDHAEGGDLVSDVGEGLHHRHAQSLVDLRGRQIVGDVEV